MTGSFAGEGRTWPAVAPPERSEQQDLDLAAALTADLAPRIGPDGSGIPAAE